MPTPTVNGAASISQRTGGLRQAAVERAAQHLAHLARPGALPGLGVKPRSRMYTKATTKVTPEHAARSR